MLELTPRATQHLLKVRAERGVEEDAAARFVSKGERVSLTFAASPADGDRVVQAEGIKVFVAADAVDALQASIIDARVANGRMALVIRRRQNRWRASAPARG